MKLKIALALVLVLQLAASAAPLCAQTRPASAFELYERGDIDGARKAFQQYLTQAHQGGNKRNLWSAYMAIAWFEDELSEHRASIEHSNKALELANELDDPFMIGRSLCWLGWAYTGLGLYQAALAFYEHATELGAPNGKITYVHVWGLATQELGALKFRMGFSAEARKILETTYQYAKDNGIDVGVAEGGAHLAEIALTQGKYTEAEMFAQSAVKAAQSCNCSLFNLTRAKVVQAKSELERSRFAPTRVEGVRKTLHELLNECERLGHIRCGAETKLLLSKTLPPEQFQQRFELVSSAFEALSNNENELRGSAEAELGKVFLEGDQVQLAQFYLKNGLDISQEMLRKVDEAHITGDLAHLDGLSGAEQEKIQKLITAVHGALAADAMPLALEKQLELVRALKQREFTTLALEQMQEALKTAEKLVAHNPKESEEAKHFMKVRLEIAEEILQLGLVLSRESNSPQT